MRLQQTALTNHRTFPQQIIYIALLAILLVATTACGKKDESHSTSSKDHGDDTSEKMTVFNIDLLDSTSVQEGTIFAFPLMTIGIDEKKPYAVEMQVVVACTKIETATELGENTNKYIGIFDLVFSTRSKSQVANSADRMNINDEIIKRLERELKKNGFDPAIREIYFTKYHIHRNYQ